MTTMMRAVGDRMRRRARTGLWLLSALPLLSLGPATAMPQQQPGGYLLYPQSDLCIVPAKTDPQAHAGDQHRFRPQLTKDAVLPMSAGNILAQSLARQHGG